MLFAFAIWNKLVPLDIVKFQVEVKNEEWIDEVNKCKAHGALRLKVHWQIKVVVLPIVIFIDDLKHITLHEFHWDVLDH